MYDYGFFSFEDKADFLRRSEEFWNPDKTRFWQDAGVDLVIDRREGYLFWDMAGRRLIDLHLNGGTYNLGHRNPELIAVLEQAMGRFDIGNHHFPALARTALAEALVATCAPNMQRVIYGSGGGEATDIAIKTARHTRQRRKIVSIRKGYHGHTGLAVATGDDRFSTLFLSDRPDEFVQVPFNDLGAMEEALRGGDVAGVVIETIPATYGFPLPEPGYLRAVKALCERYGALYIADEVQTGLMRTGEMWGVAKAGIEPDIMIVGKGITGGMYPIACCVVSEECSAWLKEDGFGHISTGGGAELGCVVALKVLEICGRPEVRSMVHYISERFRAGLSAIQESYPDWLVGIRQDGVVMGLEFDHPQGAKLVMRRLYENGVWAIFSTLDPRVLQFKPGILLGPDLVDEILDRTAVAIGQAVGGRGRGARVTPLIETEAPGTARARMMLDRARWAATAFAAYDRERTRRVVEAVAEAAYQNAERFAIAAVEETGMGVAEHKRRKNEACSRGIADRYDVGDYVDAQIDADAKIVAVPKPAGVVLALTPSTNPIATVYFKVLLALMTRNAVVVSPHPLAKQTSVAAVHVLARAAVDAGAPDGCLQVVEEPTIPLIEALMADRGVDVIVATGGTAVVRAAYRSGNPSLGVGPGNVPALVDATADVAKAAACLADSKAFDNSILCTNESVAIVEERVADRLIRELGRHGAHVLDAEEAERARAAMYPEGRINTALAGKDAAALAAAAEIKVPAKTRVLVAPFPLIVPEEPLASEKLFPLLGLVRVPDAARGIDAARALLRIGGAGHSAVIHSHDPRTILAYGAALGVLRISVNAPGSTGGSGLDTNLAPTMTVGTGFFGRSSLTENLQPQHLTQWTRLAYEVDEPFGDFADLQPWSVRPEPAPVAAPARVPDGELTRDDLRAMILDELRDLVGR